MFLTENEEIFNQYNTRFLTESKSLGDSFTPDPLPYSYNALEPYIDAETMRIHYTKHYFTYIKNANECLKEHKSIAKWTAEEILRDLNKVPKQIKDTLQNNIGGYYNHSLFWKMLSKEKSTTSEELLTHINRTFKSIKEFHKEFEEQAKKVFGSGWCWLSINSKKELIIEGTHNQDNPISLGHIPLLGLDVWEHAYYLKYQNDRAKYISMFPKIINWNYVNTRYEMSILL